MMNRTGGLQVFDGFPNAAFGYFDAQVEHQQKLGVVEKRGQFVY